MSNAIAWWPLIESGDFNDPFNLVIFPRINSNGNIGLSYKIDEKTIFAGGPVINPLFTQVFDSYYSLESNGQASYPYPSKFFLNII